MKRILSFSLPLLFVCSAAFAQQNRAEIPAGKGFVYFGFGTNLSWYSNSDISFKTATSDFTLYNVRAEDDKGLRFDNGGAPQYSYQVGYYFKKKNFGIEFNFDHIKYFVIPNQVVRVQGQIEGQAIDKDTALTPGFVQFEHSDGANYALLNFVKLKNLWSSQNKKQNLDLLLKAGGGIVIPKTNSTIMGKHYDDQYRVSGYVVALEAGVRFNFLRNLYLAPTFKGAYANYNDFIIANGRGRQTWFSGNFVVVLGGIINL